MRGQEVAMDLHAQGTKDSIEMWEWPGFLLMHSAVGQTYFLSAQVRTS